jgi:hypothetical protein
MPVNIADFRHKFHKYESEFVPHDSYFRGHKCSEDIREELGIAGIHAKIIN